MTTSLRPPTREERQLAGLWAAAAVSAVALRPVWMVLAPHLRSCTFHRLTGVPCPTCGTTRTALAILDGDIDGAVLINPLAALAGIVFIVGGLMAIPWLLFRWPVPSFGLRWTPTWTVALVAVVAANWAYVIATL